MTGKPTVEELGIDVAAQRWRRSGEGDGAIEVAIVSAADLAAGSGDLAAGSGGRAAGSDDQAAGSGDQATGAGGDWVLMRVVGDPAGRVLVYDRNEWECFLDGVRNGEFDDALGNDGVD